MTNANSRVITLAHVLTHKHKVTCILTFAFTHNTRIHTYARTHTTANTNTHKLIIFSRCWYTRTYARSRHTHAHTHAHTYTRTHCTLAAHTHTHMHTHTHARMAT